MRSRREPVAVVAIVLGALLILAAALGGAAWTLYEIFCLPFGAD